MLYNLTYVILKKKKFDVLWLVNAVNSGHFNQDKYVILPVELKAKYH